MNSESRQPATTRRTMLAEGIPGDPHVASGTDGGEETPFGIAGSGRRRVVRRTLLLGIPVLALAGVALVTRDSSDSATSGHGHGAMVAGGDTAQPVLLLGEDARRIGVTFAVATVDPMGRDVRTVGQVTFDESNVTTISPRIDGWVERLYVDMTGQPVRKGEPMLSVYSPMLVMAQEELLLAKRLEREMSAASADARRNVEELIVSARRRLAYWDVPPSEIARVERTGQVERTLTLNAPMSGIIIQKNVLQGQRIMAGDALYRVADLTTVWVEGDVFEQDLPAVRLGLPVSATFEALPGEARQGRIAYVYPTLDPDTRTAKVRIELANPGLRLKPGMYATLRLTGASRPNALSVPRSAVLSTGERNLVFVRRDDGMLEPREVVVGIANDERIEILRGLREGETVVASATFLVDAESNLGTLMGGMGDMPGMDMTAPSTPDSTATTGTGRASAPSSQAPARPAPSDQPGGEE